MKRNSVKFAPFHYHYIPCHALHRLKKIFNMRGAETTAREASRPSTCARCSQGFRGLSPWPGERLPKFKFSAKFPIGLHVILLLIQIKKNRK